MTIQAVLDVNVFISAIITRFGIPRRIWEAWRQGRFTLISSDPIINTTGAKLLLPRIARRYDIGAEHVRIFDTLVRTRATLVTISPEDVTAVTGDPEDDAVLATVRLGGAEYLVTGDRGLLNLGTYADARILSPRAFLDVLDR